jgi:hypothetical protein
VARLRGDSAEAEASSRNSESRGKWTS